MAEYYLDTFQDYLEGLCVKHKDVHHTVDGIDAFARVFSNEEMEAVANNAGKNIVVVSAFFGNAAGTLDDQRMRQVVQIRFASFADGINSTAINAAVATAWHIMWDFITRFRDDIKNGDGCEELSGAELQNISWDEIRDAPFLENHYGWELTLPFKSYQPQFDAAKWDS